jgi:hydrogenase maturation factor
MCITRVGKVLDKSGNRATIRFLDDAVTRDIDVSMLTDVGKNSYVEVFANSALNTLTPKEARWKKKLWLELRGKAGGRI